MKEKLKKFYIKHKFEIWFAGVMATLLGMSCAGLYIYKKGKDYGISLTEHESEGKAILEALQGAGIGLSALNANEIDDDIFTEIAPQIEGLLLEEGLDEGGIDKNYIIKFPKFGDAENGYYEVVKKLHVFVQDIGDVKEA